jgi:hypothetical protein
MLWAVSLQTCMFPAIFLILSEHAVLICMVKKIVLLNNRKILDYAQLLLTNTKKALSFS